MIREPQPLKPTALAVLEAVRRYHQLTTLHMMALGLSQNIASLRRAIRAELTQRKRPLLHRVSYAEDVQTAGRKRRHDLFSLTKAGAEWLELLNDEEEGSIPFFSLAGKIEQDYIHRTLAIGAILQIERLTLEKGFSVEIFPYYAPIKALPSSSPSYPREGDSSVEPDAVILLRKDGKPSHLFALEFHNRQRTTSICRQIDGICDLIASGAVSQRLGVSVPLKLISYFHSQESLMLALKRLNKAEELEAFHGHVFLTVESMASKGSGILLSCKEGVFLQ